MAPSYVQTQLPFLALLLLTYLVASETPSRRPTAALVLPVSKHVQSLQYTTLFHQGTPLVPIAHVIHLGGHVLWVGCDSTYISSSYRQAHCNSAQCSLAHQSTAGYCETETSSIDLPRRRLWCSANGTCILQLQNVFTGKTATGDLSEDAVSLKSTNGFRPGPAVSIPQFLFSCAPAFLLEGLASGAKGMVGLGHGQIALPTQLSRALNFSRKFAICLPASPDSKGVIFFGGGPYVLLPNIDVSKLLTMTPLIARPKTKSLPTTSDPLLSHDYMIRVTSIRVNGNLIPLNSVSRPSSVGVGGGEAKISTVHPYAVLDTSIYNSLVDHFVKEATAANVARVEAVAPFGVCFATEPLNAGGLPRPPMPVIDLLLHTEEVFWRIFETNSMVRVGDQVSCLAFLDGGVNPATPIVLGGHQLEDNLVQFDLVSSKVGFTSSLLLRQTGCANFEFASNV